MDFLQENQNNELGFGVQIPVRIDNLILAPVKGYQQQFLRPYDIKVTHDDLIKLENLLERTLATGTTGVNPLELVQTINILEPMRTPIDKVQIIGGWSQERAVFLLTASWVDPYTASEQVLYLTGYTDYPEINLATGTADEKMNLFPNTAILLVKVETPQGPRLKVMASFTIEYDTNTQQFNIMEDRSFDNTKLLLRPYDTLAVIDNVMEGFNTIPIESTIKNVNAVDRKDFIPVNHMQTVINSLIQGNLLSDSTYTQDVVNYGKLASKKIKIEDIEFFRRLIKDLGLTPGLSFPLGWLKKLDPYFTGDKLIIANGIQSEVMMNGMASGQIVTGENIFNNNIPLILTSQIGENAADATMESAIATLVRDAVSSLMTKNMLLDIAFSLTNNTFDSNPIFQPYLALPAIPGVNTIMLVEKFKTEFLNMIYPQISHNGKLLIDIDVYSSVTGDTKIAVSINGMEKRLFKFPTFADSLYNALLTNKDLFIKVTQDYKTIVDQTLAAVSANAEDYTTAPIVDKYNF